jgi:hypothetical protein
MSQNLSAEEVEQQHLDALGSTLGPLYHALYNEVTWLHAKWLEYRKLFAHSPKRIELLNQASGFFFRMIQGVLWEDVLLHIARLTDPPRHGKYGNLTLRQLPRAVPDAQVAADVKSLVNKAKSNSIFARRWRNRRLAHSDLRLALERGAEALPGVSRQHVEDALASFRAVLNRVNSHFLHGEVAFEVFIAPCGDADTLAYHLRVATHFEEQRLKRLRNGQALPEDFELPPEE